MRGLSIKLKLPLLIGGLVVAVTGVYAYSDYRAASRAAIKVATDQLGTVTDQFAEMLHTSRNQLVMHLDSVTRQPVIAAYLDHPAPAREAAVLHALNPSPERTPTLAGVALWSADGRRLLSQGEAPRRGLALDTSLLN